MSPLQLELDPVAVRQELQRQRARGVPFTEAWKVATNYRTAKDCEPGVYLFMRKHFEAAYNGDGSPRGRCMVPACDTSKAIPITRFTGRLTAAAGDITGDASSKARHDHERCRSGDGCDRLATCGRFGKMWCEFHGAELERIAERVQDLVGRLDPRKGNQPIRGRAA